MSVESQLEREEQAIEESYNRGDITRGELNKQLRELHQDYQAQAEESAQGAYDDEMARW